jgi:tRNA(fMet)-specific endonuclease VapC
VKILDTDTCIEILRGNTKVLERRASEDDDVGTTWIAAAELYFGAAKSTDPERNRDLVRAFLDTLSVLGLDRASAERFGACKAELAKAGAIVPDADLWIAATAITQEAAVITGNRRHFDRIHGVRLEDWIRG